MRLQDAIAEQALASELVILRALQEVDSSLVAYLNEGALRLMAEAVGQSAGDRVEQRVMPAG